MNSNPPKPAVVVTRPEPSAWARLTRSLGLEPALPGARDWQRAQQRFPPPALPSALPGTPWSSGWLDRQGRFYPCLDFGHEALGAALLAGPYARVEGADPDCFFDNLGWVKISVNRVVFHGPWGTLGCPADEAEYRSYHRFSPSQLLAVIDWLEARHKTTCTYNGQAEFTIRQLLLAHHPA